MDTYEYTPLYYTTFTFVRFRSYESGEWNNGVAYHDLIWDGSNKVFNIEDIIKSATDNGVHFDDAIIEFAWRI